MKGDICKIEGCSTIVRTGKVCEVHGWRMRKYGSYEKPSRKRFGDKCRAEGCDKLRDGRHSVCPMHRTRLSRHKSLELPIFSYPEGIVHECEIHGLLKLEDAYKNPKYGHYSCVKCRRENDKKFYKDNPTLERGHYKNYIYIKTKTDNFRVPKEHYNYLLKQQNGLCAICSKAESAVDSKKRATSKTRRLALDHKHGTQKVRGLLCYYCNLMIGYAKDSIEILQSAIDYLKKHQ